MNFFTFPPISSTTPANSWPRMTGSSGVAVREVPILRPTAVMMSSMLRAVATTFTNTWSALMLGRGTSSATERRSVMSCLVAGRPERWTALM